MSKFKTRVSINDQNFTQQTGDTLTLYGNVAYGVNPLREFTKNTIANVDYVTGITSSGVISGSTNGLNTVNKSIRLGGALINDTNIYASGYTLSFLDNINTTGISIDSQVAGGSIQLAHSYVGNLEFKSTGAIFTDIRGTKRGIQYNADYSTGFNARSLVDAGFVTGITSNLGGGGGTGTTNAGNGLTKTGSTIVLGGDVNTVPTILGPITTGGLVLNDNAIWGSGTGTTTFFSGDGTWGDASMDGSYALTLLSSYRNSENAITSIYSENYVPSLYDFWNDIDFGVNSSNSYITNIVTAYDTNTFYNSRLDIDLRATLNNPPTAIITSSASGFSGLQYGGDYSNGFNARSLVDAGFVTGITSNLSGGGGTITDGSNGLRKSGSNIVLGGILTGNTVISANTITIDHYATKNLQFNIGTGFSNMVFSTVKQLDGKILIGGGFTDFNGTTNNRLIRLNLDGTKDNSFNIGSGFNDFINTIAIQSDGKILVGGDFTTFTGSTNNHLIRLNSNGTKDNSFNIGSGFNASIQVITVQPDDKILIGGFFNQFTGSTNGELIRLNSDGTKDLTFNIGVGFSSNFVNNIVIDSNNKILVGGSFTTFTGSSVNTLVRLNSDGTKDLTFNIGGGFDGGIFGIAIQQDTKIIVGGNFQNFTGSTNGRIIRLNSDGTKDTAFITGNGFSNVVDSILLQSDNKIIVGGSFGAYSGQTSNNLIRLNSNGSKDNSFNIGNGFNGAVFQTVEVGNILFVGGGFTTYTGSTNNYLIGLNNYSETFVNAIEYGDDYSTNFTARSLVDAGFVTGITSTLGSGTGTTNAGNGLTRQGVVVKLGGTLTGITNINGSQILNFGATTRLAQFNVMTSNVTTLTSYDTGITSHSGINTTGSASELYVNGGGSFMGYSVSYGGGLYITDQAYARGVRYVSNYGSNFTARSLVDAGFVTGITAQIQPVGIKKYIVNLTQTGTTAPTVKRTFQNTMGVTPTYSYDSTGSYLMTFPSGISDPSKVFLSWNNDNSFYRTIILTVDTNLIFINMVNQSGAPVDDSVNNIFIDITVYP